MPAAEQMLQSKCTTSSHAMPSLDPVALSWDAAVGVFAVGFVLISPSAMLDTFSCSMSTWSSNNLTCSARASLSWATLSTSNTLFIVALLVMPSTLHLLALVTVCRVGMEWQSITKLQTKKKNTTVTRRTPKSEHPTAAT